MTHENKPKKNDLLVGQKLKRIKVENQECLYERGDCKEHLAPLTYETISVMSRRQMAELHGVINNLKSHFILSDSFNNFSVTPNEIQLNSFFFSPLPG